MSEEKSLLDAVKRIAQAPSFYAVSQPQKEAATSAAVAASGV